LVNRYCPFCAWRHSFWPLTIIKGGPEPLEKKIKISCAKREATNLQTLFLNWYPKHVSFVFCTFFGTVIYVCAGGHCERSRRRDRRHGVASVRRIDKIIGLLCKRALSNRRYSAKEICSFIDFTSRDHPIAFC